MKKFFLVITIGSLFISNALTAQKLVLDEVDDFFGIHKKQTSYITIMMTFMDIYAAIGFNSYATNDIPEYNVRIKMQMASVYAVDKDDLLMFKFNDESIMSLNNMEFVISSPNTAGAGYKNTGAYLMFDITKEQLEQLLEKEIVKFRLYTTDGYIENEVSEKANVKLNKAINLIL